MNTPVTYYWTRFFLLRSLGMVYLVAFLALALQFKPLLGSHGLTPVAKFLASLRAEGYSSGSGFKTLPSLFWFNASDTLMQNLAWLGFGLAALLVLGVSNPLLLLALWALYLSFVNVGQVWYGYGWEIQLCETGFLAIFLAPPSAWGPFPSQAVAPVMPWLFRWLIFRIMLGAALIKLRGDSCWRDFTCLDYHFETQPLPNPLSPYFHFAPVFMRRAGVLFTYAAELVAPFFAMLPWAPARVSAGALMLAFKGSLMLSGNLSFLNWLTVVPILACFDDRQWMAIMPKSIASLALPAHALPCPSYWNAAAWVLLALIAWLSQGPVKNLLSSRQAMNTSFDRLNLVNTYGAFGSVGRERLQLVFEGTQGDAADPLANWQPYVFKCQPGPLERRPCVCAPYQYRLDWQVWFAAMEQPGQEPWVFPLIWKLLGNAPDALSLFANNPFTQSPPRMIRVKLYRYQFESLSHPNGRWWKREELGLWLPPLSRQHPELRRVLAMMGRDDLLAEE